MSSRCIMLVIYKDREGARQMLDRLEKMDQEEVIQVEDAAVIDKEMDGTIRVDDKEDVNAGRGALVGALSGALVGLLAGPGGAIVGAAAGAVTGGAAASVLDLGMDKNAVERLKSELKPGTSALVAVIEDKWAPRLAETMDGEIRSGVAHFYHEIKAEAVEQWKKGERVVAEIFDEDDDTA
jgi:uncharacterized membrane protein